jgi:D-alanine-D-alanine ligase
MLRKQTNCIPEKTQVAVLKGGTSAELEVSLNTGHNCAEALRQQGFIVTEYDTADQGFIAGLQQTKPDLAFIALHGRCGEDGTMQGLLELLQIPYTGSGVLASALAMDKLMTKSIYTQAGLMTPPSLSAFHGNGFSVAALVERALDELGDTLVIKPNKEGSSVGVNIVHNRAELTKAMQEAFRYDRHVLIERFIPGREIMAGVIDTYTDDACALPLIEVEAKAGEFYDYDSKYAPGGSRHIVPAVLDEELTLLCQRLAVDAHKALGCRGYSRSDIRLDPAGTAWLLETNTLPGMTATSLLPEAARAVGIEFPELCTLLVNLALR